MKNLFYACGFILILCTYAVNPSSAQYIDDKGEWKFKDTVVLNGTIYAVEKCEKTLFGSCTIGTYQSVPAPVIAP
jgi:hypothetical protein